MPERSIVKLIGLIVFASYLMLMTVQLLASTEEQESAEIDETIHNNMHKCVLLPIWDTAGSSFGYKVFEKVEEYLKESQWCIYRTNSEVLNVLNNYNENLNKLLETPDVLKMIANKTDAGSLIKVDIVQAQGKSEFDVFIKIFGNNGYDLYFSEEAHIVKEDIPIFANVVVTWLKEYEKIIPYEGVITGVLGEQFVIDNDNDGIVKIGDQVAIRRFTKKKAHPLLRKIIEWESELIGYAEIVGTSDHQATGVVREYQQKRKMKKGDIVKMEINNKRMGETSLFPTPKGYEFGKIGNAGVNIVIGQGECTTIKGGQTRKIGGSLLGIQATGELWATRNYFAGLEVEKSIGDYGKKLGNISSEQNSVAVSRYKGKAGYRYLVLGFFNGPQADGYVGYARYTHSLDINTNEGFGENSIFGILTGLKVDVPIYQDLRTFFRLDFFLRPGFSEEMSMYGDPDRADAYEIEIGGAYNLGMVIKINASLQMNSSEAKFSKPHAKIRYKETSLKAGIIFNF
ncbi:MAG: hypothetical protein HQK50_15600 [Oligoflexia bacterium]|nr:hypothetical protein [Oligoflexia bacterium]